MTEEADNGPESELRKAREAALNYLARREHSCRELETKLLRRGIGAEAASTVVEQLGSENLVSDERYVEAYVRSRVARLFGPLRIRAELRKRGVADTLVERELEAYAGEWFELADQWAAGRLRNELDRKEQARIYRSGTNRGFTHEQMMRAIDRLKRSR
jgi:regulatory protein